MITFATLQHEDKIQQGRGMCVSGVKVSRYYLREAALPFYASFHNSQKNEFAPFTVSIWAWLFKSNDVFLVNVSLKISNVNSRNSPIVFVEKSDSVFVYKIVKHLMS